jgi:predicted GTPase
VDEQPAVLPAAVQQGRPGQPPEWSQEAFNAAFDEQAAQIGRFNLAIFGKTGVGKSTLVNAIFGEQVAATGIGRPVTQGSHLYVHRTGKLGIYDTQGLEVGRDTERIVHELSDFIQAAALRPFPEQVHLAWYCVRATDRRFEQTEGVFIAKLVQIGLPVILVMTQVPARRDVEGTLYVAPDA